MIYLISGFGYGLAFLSGTVAIGCYFYKRRALAIGISFCGSGVGTFVIPPLLRLLLEIYTWRGTMFILAGIALNGCVLSAFYRPLEEEDEIEIVSIDENHTVPNTVDKAAENGVAISKNGHLPLDSHSPLLNSNGCVVQNGIRKGSKEIHLTRTFEEIKKEQLLNLKENPDHGSHRSLNMSVLSQSILGSAASFDYVFERRSRYKLSNLSLQAPSITSVKTVIESEKRFKISALENIFPKALVANINFVIFMISTLFIGITAFVPFSMLPDYAMSNGATPLQGAWLLSAIGIGGRCT